MKTICIFGDSITWGRGLPERTGWANLLRNEFEKEANPFPHIYDLGIDGDTSSGLLKRFDIEASVRNPDVIIFAIGTNDSVYRNSRGNVEITVEKFKNNLQLLIDKAKKFTKYIIFIGLAKGRDNLTTPLPESKTGKCYDKENMGLYNEAIKEMVGKNNLGLVSIFELLDDDDFYNGLHPNEKGHEKIFKQVKKTLT